MARLEEMPEAQRKHLEELPCPTFERTPYVTGPPLSERRVAMVSTAGLHHRDDRPFTFDPGDDYRVIRKEIRAHELVMSHVSTNFDHTGFQQDWNVVFPMDRLRELEQEGVIGSMADFHYAFMGALDPMPMETEARQVARLLKEDGVDALLLVPV